MVKSWQYFVSESNRPTLPRGTSHSEAGLPRLLLPAHTQAELGDGAQSSTGPGSRAALTWLPLLIHLGESVGIFKCLEFFDLMFIFK